jgi:galactosamine-6-phosphate isomerase
MQLKIYDDHHGLSDAAANDIISLVRNKPDAVVCLASGETPRLTCQFLVQKIKNEKADISRLTLIGLDEWVNIPPDNEGSCHYFFKNELINPLQIPERQVHLFNAMSDKLQDECRRMDAVVRDKGGIDLMVVGIGMNGHIGFNEPGVSFDNYSHVIDLDDTTLTVGQKYFKSKVTLQKGITLGLRHLSESKKVYLLANGTKKAEVVRRTVEEMVTNEFPASIMQTHANGFVMVDKDAASSLKQKR